MRRKSLFTILFALSAAAHADSYKNSIVLALGANDEADFKYERRIHDFGIGINPGLGSYLLDHYYFRNNISGQGYQPNRGYQPALYFSYAFQAGTNFQIKPELKIAYNYLKGNNDLRRPNTAMLPLPYVSDTVLVNSPDSGTAFHTYTDIFSPRINFQWNFNRLNLGLYTGVTKGFWTSIGNYVNSGNWYPVAGTSASTARGTRTFMIFGIYSGLNF